MAEFDELLRKFIPYIQEKYTAWACVRSMGYKAADSISLDCLGRAKETLTDFLEPLPHELAW